MKKELKTQLTKEKIIKAAMAEFGTKGYSGASLNNICSEGISKGLLYHNFENKDALYLACIEHSFRKLTVFLKEENIGADFQRYIDARMRFWRENEQEARLFFETILQPPMHLNERIDKLRHEFDCFNQELYRNLLDEIHLRKDVDRQAALEYFTLMQNMFNAYFSSPAFCGLSFTDAAVIHEQELSRIFDFVLYGIAERKAELC